MLHARELAAAGLLVAGHLLGRRVVHVRAESRDLDHFMLAAAPEHHVHDAKAPADDERAAEERLHLLRRRGRGHVEILGAKAQQQVAHRAADDVRLVAGFLERVDDVGGPLVDQRRVDAVLLGADFAPLAEIRTRRFTAAKQLVDESFDHGSEKRSSMRQPRCVAMARRRSSGLVATGWATRSSSGRSFIESE